MQTIRLDYNDNLFMELRNKNGLNDRWKDFHTTEGKLKLGEVGSMDGVTIDRMRHLAIPLEGIFSAILGEEFYVYRATNEQIHTLMDNIKLGDRTMSEIYDPVVLGNDRDRAVALGAVSWRVQRELAGYGQRDYAGRNGDVTGKVANTEKMYFTKPDGEVISVDTSNYIREIKKPNFFKRLLNTLFGAYQDEIDDYALTETMNRRARASAETTVPVRESRPAETNSREAQEEATRSAPSQERSMSEAENTNHIEAENETRERTNFNELNKTSTRTTSAVEREKEATKSDPTLN